MDDLRLLQRPPAQEEAATKTLNLINDRFSSWNSLLVSDEFEVWIHESQKQAAELKGKVSHCLHHSSARRLILLARSFDRNLVKGTAGRYRAYQICHNVCSGRCVIKTYTSRRFCEPFNGARILIRARHWSSDTLRRFGSIASSAQRTGKCAALCPCDRKGAESEVRFAFGH